jgi:hypothetical protein
VMFAYLPFINESMSKQIVVSYVWSSRTQVLLYCPEGNIYY